MHQIQLIKKYQVKPNKTKGQNFLIDENIQRKMIELFDPQSSDAILEIGPGLGALTHHLVNTGAKVVAVEKDDRLAEILREEFREYHNLTIINEDILNFDFEKFFGTKQPVKVIGNLPYYISSPILFYLLEHRKYIDQAMVMLEKEYSDRLLAQPGNKNYSRLTLGVRYYTDVEFCFKVSKNCYTPVPRVASAILKMKFRKGERVVGLNEELLFRLVKIAFANRRKNILNNLAQSDFEREKEEWIAILQIVGIDYQKRAEELHLKDYIALTQCLTGAEKL